jgi:hypothetical protein
MPLLPATGRALWPSGDQHLFPQIPAQTHPGIWEAPRQLTKPWGRPDPCCCSGSLARLCISSRQQGSPYSLSSMWDTGGFHHGPLTLTSTASAKTLSTEEGGLVKAEETGIVSVCAFCFGHLSRLSSVKVASGQRDNSLSDHIAL